MGFGKIRDIMAKNKMLVHCYRSLRNTGYDIKSIYRLKKYKKHMVAGKKIKVAFLCQYIPAWNKFEKLYNVLKDRDEFEAYIVCVPPDINMHKRSNPQSMNNETYEYFLSQGYEAINALVGEGKWFDLQKLACDYIFYTRPYNSYMPEPYVSSVVCRYTRIASMLYAMNMTEDTYDVTLNYDFYKDVYVFFAETKTTLDYYQKKFRISSMFRVRKSYFLGMPALEQVLDDCEKESRSWEFSKNKFRILWTPRWTTDKSLGGSNFFVYYKLLLEYAENNPEVDILMRPHPLMFDHFRETGELSEKEEQDYKQRICELPNVQLDEEPEYDATMWGTTVMLSDISGILPEFFVTGKPLIYCSSNMILKPAGHTREMLKGCYVADEPEKVFSFLDMLRRGEDPKQQLRKEIANEVFGLSNAGFAENIADKMIGLVI